MKEKLIAIGILAMFLLIGFTTASAVGITKFQKSNNVSPISEDVDLAALLITGTPVFGESKYKVGAGIYNNGTTVVNIKDMKIVVEIIDQGSKIIDSDISTFDEDIALDPKNMFTHNFQYPFSYNNYKIGVTLDFSNRPDLNDLDHTNDYTERNFPKSVQKQKLPTPTFNFQLLKFLEHHQMLFQRFLALKPNQYPSSFFFCL